jgi:site-specific DNA recombinase
MSIAIYARVSTQRQAQAQTIEQQLDRLHAHVAAQGWAVLDQHVFRDDGYSGASLRRPGLDRLRDAAAAGEVDRVLLTAPDRLARNYVHQALLLEEMERAGCLVEFLDRPMGRDPNDQLLLQIRGAVAEYERSVLAERMRRGRQAKLRAGLLLPWTRAPYGYRLDPDRPRDPAGVRVEAAEAAVVQELFASYLEDGVGLIGLAKLLSRRGLVTPTGQAHWNAATVRGILTNPSYTGQVYAGRSQARPPRGRHSALRPIGRPSTTQVPMPRAAWIPVATIPALIGEELFEQVQAKLARNQQFARRNNSARDYLLRALVSCGHCRTACSGRSDRKKRYDYYVCRGKGPAVASHREEHCPARYIPVQSLDDLVWQDLCAVLTQPEQIARALARAQGGHWSSQELQARREVLRQGLASLDQQVERLTAAYLGGIMPLAEYQRRRGEVEQKRGGLEEQRRHLEAQAAGQVDVAAQVQGAEAFCRRVQAGLTGASFAQRRQLVELLIDRVVVTDDEVEIRYVVPTSPRGEHTRFCHLRLDYFDRPLSPPQRLDDGRRRRRRPAGDAVGHLLLDLARREPQAAARAPEPLPHPRPGERGRAHRAALQGALLQPAVALARRRDGLGGPARRGAEDGLDPAPQVGAVALDDHPGVAVLGEDLPGQRPRGQPGVQRRHRAAHVAPGQQRRPGGDRRAAAGHRPLGEHAGVGVAHQADQLEPRAVAVGAAHRLAVRRLAGPRRGGRRGRRRQAGREAGDAGLQGGHIDAPQRPPQGGRARQAPARRGEGDHQVGGVLGHPLADRPPAALPADHGGGDEHEQQRPRLAAAPPAARVGDVGEHRAQAGILRTVHWLPPRVVPASPTPRV